MPRRLPAEQVDAIEFGGAIYRRYPFSKHVSHQRYYSPGGTDRANGKEALHREIWKKHHGPIPADHDIHHRDDNPLNNEVSNLECIHRDDHKALHESEGKWSASIRVREHLTGIRRLALDWHASQEGILWHRQQARTSYAKREPREFECAVCGKPFHSKHRSSHREDGKRFCSMRCGGIQRRKEERQKRDLLCSQCGSHYRGDGRGTTCSRKCRADLRRVRAGFPSVTPIEVAAWRRERGATIPATAAQFNLSKATVVRYCSRARAL